MALRAGRPSVLRSERGPLLSRPRQPLALTFLGCAVRVPLRLRTLLRFGQSQGSLATAPLRSACSLPFVSPASLPMPRPAPQPPEPADMAPRIWGAVSPLPPNETPWSLDYIFILFLNIIYPESGSQDSELSRTV